MKAACVYGFLNFNDFCTIIFILSQVCHYLVKKKNPDPSFILKERVSLDFKCKIIFMMHFHCFILLKEEKKKYFLRLKGAQE